MQYTSYENSRAPKCTVDEDLFQDTKMFAHGALHHVHGKVHAPQGDEDGCGLNLK